MFPASGYGPLPPSAMAEIEKRMAAAMRNSNFQKMLELEKKHKVRSARRPPVACRLGSCWFLCLLAVSYRDMSNTASYFRWRDYIVRRHPLRHLRRRLNTKKSHCRSAVPTRSLSSKTT